MSRACFSGSPVVTLLWLPAALGHLHFLCPGIPCIPSVDPGCPALQAPGRPISHSACSGGPALPLVHGSLEAQRGGGAALGSPLASLVPSPWAPEPHLEPWAERNCREAEQPVEGSTRTASQPDALEDVERRWPQPWRVLGLDNVAFPRARAACPPTACSFSIRI